MIIHAFDGSIVNGHNSATNFNGNHVALIATADIGSEEHPVTTSTSVLQAISNKDGNVFVSNKDMDLNLIAWMEPGNSIQTHHGVVHVQNTTHGIKLVDPIMSDSDLILKAASTVESVNPSRVLTANQIEINSKYGIGSSENPILLHATNLQATVSNKGDLYISSTGSDLNLKAWNKSENSIYTKNGSINIQGLTDSLIIHHPIRTENDGNVRIDAANNVILGEISAGKGNIYVNAISGTIQSIDNGKPNISGGKAYLSADLDIGTKDSGVINTSVDTLQTIVKSSGDIIVENDRTVVLAAWNEPGKSVQTPSGEIDITAQGNLGVKNPVKTNSEEPVKLTATKGTIIQTNGALTDNDELYSLKEEMFEKGGIFGGKMIWHKAKKFNSPCIIQRAAVTSAYEQKYYLYPYEPNEIFPTVSYIIDPCDCLSP